MAMFKNRTKPTILSSHVDNRCVEPKSVLFRESDGGVLCTLLG